MSIQIQILYKVSKALEIRFCAIFQRQIQLVNNTYWHQIRANCIPDMIFLYLSKSIYNCCRWARTTFCSSTEWWLSSVGSRGISAKVSPPPQRLTSEFKFSPNLYKINCIWSMESFYVGSETDIFSSDFLMIQLFNHHWANMYQTQKAGASL